jgi:hypothetical protein
VATVRTASGAVIKVDAADLKWAKQHCWFVSHNGYAYRHLKKGTARMHRELMHAPRSKDVDHINGDRLDNRRANLRIASRSNNLKNKTRRRSDNTTGVTGVYWHQQCRKWTAQIHINGRAKHLGLFATKAGAAKARRVAEIHHYREFAPRSI